MLQHRMNIKRARVELQENLGRTPTNEEIRVHLGITADRFRDILRTNMRTSSLHEHDRVTGREKVENFVSGEDALTTYASSTSMVQYGLDDVVSATGPSLNLFTQLHCFSFAWSFIRMELFCEVLELQCCCVGLGLISQFGERRLIF